MAEQLGIVFTGGEGPKPEVIKRIMEQGTGSRGIRPLLVAADSGLLLAEEAGYRPDFVIGDMDSLDSEKRLQSYPADCVIRHSPEKDFTDTELALALLRDKGCIETWLVGGGGGRLAHLFGIREMFEGEYYPERWVTAADDIYCICAGGSFKQEVETGAVVSVFLLGSGPWEAASTGLKWSLNNLNWKRGMTGLSNIATTGKIDINIKQGRLLIVLEDMWRQ